MLLRCVAFRGGVGDVSIRRVPDGFLIDQTETAGYTSDDDAGNAPIAQRN